MRGLSTRRGAFTACCVASLLVTVAVGGTPASAADPTSSPTPTTASDSASSSSSSTDRASTRAEQRQAQRDAAKAREKAKADARAEAAGRADTKAKRAAEDAKKAAEQAAADAHDAAVLVQASQDLAAAEADLADARTTLVEAQGALADARDIDAQAQIDLDAAVLAQERATRELADVEARINARVADLGRLARVAYQSNGSLGEWAIVLSSANPNQLADRLAFLQSVGSAGNAVIAELTVARAELLNAQARLTAARLEAQVRRSAAADALTALKAKELLARAAEQQVQTVVAARKVALEAARAAAVEDRRQYQVMVVQSGALGARIVELSAQLAKGKNPVKGTGEFVRPSTGPDTSPYGPRLHPILNYVKVHTGLDIGAGDGFVYAADDGVVLFTEYNVAYGNMTVIDHGKIGGLRIATLYAHQAVAGVKAGDRVTKGQAIGVIGSTGYSTGPHLHFEVRVDGEPIDPAPFLTGAKQPAGAVGSRLRGIG